jgi:hypothetical protein
MKNKIQEFIEEIEAKTVRNELDDKLLEMLLQKQEELGENPSDQEAEEAVRQVIREHFMFALRQKFAEGNHSDEDDEPENDSTDIDLEEEISLVREVFKKMDLHFRDYRHQRGVHTFELGIRENGKQLRMKIYLEADPKVCRMDAIYPFTADKEFAYPLCEKLLEENYPRRYGALEYDARDGELAYRYSFPMTHGLYKDDFRTIFLTVIKSAMTSFDTVKQYATGRFRKDIRKNIIDQVQKLLNELE